MAKLINLMRQAGVQWPEGAEYAAQDGDDFEVYFYSEEPSISGHLVWAARGLFDISSISLGELADDWRAPVTREQWFDCLPQQAYHTSPDYMREQQRLAARNTERRDLVRELMLRHPELTGPQAIVQANEILGTLEGLK